MKSYLITPGLAILVLAGCQSTATPTVNTSSAVSVCDIGDDYKDMRSNWASYEQSIQDCGGAKNVEQAMIQNHTFARKNNKGQVVYYRFDPAGQGVYVGKSGEERISWTIDNDKYLNISMPNSWKVTWVLTDTQENTWGVKVYERNPSEQYLWSAAYTVSPNSQE
ncbi:hypothetical protein [Photobacterium sp. TY1-4]|uniref:hypothetical protein n=1 Tax=Photobacterium sp. TY1-4 TaxID=2899122 RepID=UPI0021BF5A93|nr:hypothetical protein [Photobacterium sp. TY1-4]UXI04553.1 hypothetical protein NH461_20940 [Photobacterium sp. TY1-4]